MPEICSGRVAAGPVRAEGMPKFRAAEAAKCRKHICSPLAGAGLWSMQHAMRCHSISLLLSSLLDSVRRRSVDKAPQADIHHQT